MEDFITRTEHNEYAQRIDAENKRQNERLRLLEENVSHITALTASVEKLAVSMEHMAKEQEKQGTRLEALEGRDGEMWRKVVAYIATAIVGIVLGFVFTRVGM